MKKPKLKRYAEEIKVRGQFKGEPDEVRTRMSKRTFEAKQSEFNTFMSEDLGGYDYLDFVEWGGDNAGAGRPRLYDSEGAKCKHYRIRKKVKEGKELNHQEIGWLRSKGLNVPGKQQLGKIK